LSEERCSARMRRWRRWSFLEPASGAPEAWCERSAAGSASRDENAAARRPGHRADARLDSTEEGERVTAQQPLLLVIEDEPQMLPFLRASLGTRGYRLLESTTATDGLAQAATRSPDLIMLDLGLPDLDGLEVMRRLREWTRIPIIVVSARVQDEDKIRALDE